MKVFLGSDHNGYAAKNDIFGYLSTREIDVEDVSSKELNPDDDFPTFAQLAATKLLGSDDDARAILLCGSGQGMCMAANRFKGIRACLGYNHNSVVSARNDDDANVLCLPANELSQTEMRKLTDLFLETEFDGAARFKRRIQEMDSI